MISQVRKIRNIARKIDSTSLTFNTNLPISITVLEELHNERYKLLLGKKEFIAKSKKKLSASKKYWGDLNDNKEGIITISNLVEKPNIFNSEMDFLEIQNQSFFDVLEKEEKPLTTIKRYIIDKMNHDETSKEQFTTLSYMLLALSEGIFHLPMLINGRKILLQFSIKRSNYIEFYLAFENIGPLKGIIMPYHKNTILDISTMFEKSYHFLKNQFENFNKNIKISIKNELKPLFDSSSILLDLKG